MNARPTDLARLDALTMVHRKYAHENGETLDQEGDWLSSLCLMSLGTFWSISTSWSGHWRVLRCTSHGLHTSTEYLYLLALRTLGSRENGVRLKGYVPATGAGIRYPPRLIGCGALSGRNWQRRTAIISSARKKSRYASPWTPARPRRDLFPASLLFSTISTILSLAVSCSLLFLLLQDPDFRLSIMFRHGIRRYASLAGGVASSSVLLRSRAALPIARQALAALSRPNVPLKAVAQFSRTYSSEAVAQESQDTEGASVAAPGEVVQFADLAQQGVHENLLRAITQDMGYEVMTPVQAKTINPALKGTDM